MALLPRRVLTGLLAAIALITLNGCGEPELAGAPDVRGLNLADADIALKRAGFNSTIREDDGVFGVIIRTKFVVCNQHDTEGKIVPIDVAKRGC